MTGESPTSIHRPRISPRGRTATPERTGTDGAAAAARGGIGAATNPDEGAHVSRGGEAAEDERSRGLLRLRASHPPIVSRSAWPSGGSGTAGERPTDGWGRTGRRPGRRSRAPARARGRRAMVLKAEGHSAIAGRSRRRGAIRESLIETSWRAARAPRAASIRRS